MEVSPVGRCRLESGGERLGDTGPKVGILASGWDGWEDVDREEKGV